MQLYRTGDIVIHESRVEEVRYDQPEQVQGKGKANMARSQPRESQSDKDAYPLFDGEASEVSAANHDEDVLHPLTEQCPGKDSGYFSGDLFSL